MTGWLPGAAEEVFGTGASAEEAYGLLTVDVPADTWTASLDTARRVLGCTYFDWLSAVDEPGTGFRVCAHVVALAPVRRLLLRTTVPHETPALASAVGVYAGAAWHERETHEMFGLRFEGHPGLTPLLLPETFEGHPLRKDFVLAARVAKAWPGAKEPGESGHGTPKRRQMLPPGVPDPNEWGPLKGQLPEAPARPARRTRTAGGAAAGTGRAGGTGAGAGPGTGATPGAGAAEGAPARRSRSASAGSASQREEPGAAPARRSRTASEGSATQRTEPGPAPARRSRTASEGSATQRRETTEGGATPAGSPDAPWHHARPAFEDTRPSGEAAGEREKPRTGTLGAEAGTRGAEAATRGAEARAEADAASRAGKSPAEEPGAEEPRSEEPGTEEPRTEDARRRRTPALKTPTAPAPKTSRPKTPRPKIPVPENPAGGEPA
ncbi:NADH-quinone oxidoreductase subunit C [Streptomyces sp. DfronAA-171]|uniref:NADH-quinone oxidoreductase subunit C n=1 Tax=Streptomyces sp. DfronAA-171 TaxID=1839777 RepID=UPI00081EC535|nr:NADH-quinone oxidoreductase subunit C [Streptomyces sp. DfronAA-171]SCE00832.1 NADH:ubiquinone oxidoreductase subunit (chain C) [Streptomyces sp. DfronAA-171]